MGKYKESSLETKEAFEKIIDLSIKIEENQEKAAKIAEKIGTKEQEQIIREFAMEQLEMGKDLIDLPKLKSRKEFYKAKLVPVFEDIDEKIYLGIGEIIFGPNRIVNFSEKKVAVCKIRFYGTNKECHHWINLRYLNENS